MRGSVGDYRGTSLTNLLFQVYDLKHISPNVHALMAAARTLSPNICLYLPRNASVTQVRRIGSHMSQPQRNHHLKILDLALDGETVELQQDFLNQKLKTLTVYFNGLARVQ